MHTNDPRERQIFEQRAMNQLTENQLTDASDGDLEFQERDWLAHGLIKQANYLSGLPLSVRDQAESADHVPTNAPTVYQLRERTLRRREKRARVLSFASSAAVLISLLGWGIHSFQQQTNSSGLVPVSAEGNLANLTPVSARTSLESGDTYLDPVADQYQMVARWWEPVTVEWVDANGRSLGVAGVVAEERTSTLDPAKLSEEQLQLIKAYLSESQHDQARNHFTSSLDPAF